MGRHRLLTVMALLLSAVVLLPGSGLATPSGAPGDGSALTAADRMKARAERIQERRKARISHTDRQTAAGRSKAAKGTTTPGKAGKGGAP